MRQIAYPAALSGCVLGAGTGPALLHAAEWSLTPNYSASTDYDSNRRLLPDRKDKKASGASVLTVDLLFKRALEDLQFTLEPRYSLRRYTDSSLGNGDDRIVNAGLNWTGERSTLNLTGSYWDQSTLVTEVLETGLISADTHRRTTTAGASWNWSQTERRMLIAQFSWQDVSYYGRGQGQLPGYRYPSGNVGERFSFSERGYVTFSTYGSLLRSDTEGNSSHSVGLQAEMYYTLSEKTDVDASIGESVRVLAGQNSSGTDASLSLNHSLELGKLSLGYTRSLVPYGFGFLVERQQYTATFSRALTPFLDWTASFLQIRNNETAVLLRLDRRIYSSVATGLHWHPTETWSAALTAENVRTQTPDFAARSVIGWRSSLSFTWAPIPKSRSW